jgi:hypothetical protein
MLRYRPQDTCFDPAKLPGSVRFINLSRVVLKQDLGEVLEEIVKEVKRPAPPSWLWTPLAPRCASRKAIWTCNASFGLDREFRVAERYGIPQVSSTGADET